MLDKIFRSVVKIFEILLHVQVLVEHFFITFLEDEGNTFCKLKKLKVLLNIWRFKESLIVH